MHTRCACGAVALRVNRYTGKVRMALKDGVVHDKDGCHPPTYLSLFEMARGSKRKDGAR